MSLKDVVETVDFSLRLCSLSDQEIIVLPWGSQKFNDQ